MKVTKFIEFFLPREGRFYTMLNQMTQHASHSCDLLAKLAAERDVEKQKQLSEEIVRLRKDAKSQMNELHATIVNSFMTPFDREDLQELSSILYRIPKQADKIRSRLMLHVITLDDKNIAQLMGIINEAAQALNELVDNMNKHQIVKMRKEARRIENLEHKADDILVEVASAFAKTDKDFFKALLKKDVFEMLEKLTDLYKDGSDIAMRIILKHT